jgi:hypothetical protein
MPIPVTDSPSHDQPFHTVLSPGRLGFRSLRFLLVGLLIVSGCTTRAAGYDPDDSLVPGGVMITRNQIERSRANTALEALERAHTHLVIQRTGRDGQGQITHRGRDSVAHDGDVLVVVDGTPTMEAARVLHNIDAQHVAFMKVLSAREGTPRYGMLAGNGVVYVRTLAYELPGARNRMGAR